MTSPQQVRWPHPLSPPLQMQALPRLAPLPSGHFRQAARGSGSLVSTGVPLPSLYTWPGKNCVTHVWHQLPHLASEQPPELLGTGHQVCCPSAAFLGLRVIRRRRGFPPNPHLRARRVASRLQRAAGWVEASGSGRPALSGPPALGGPAAPPRQATEANSLLLNGLFRRPQPCVWHLVPGVQLLKS